MEWLSDPTIWIGLATLIVLEIGHTPFSSIARITISSLWPSGLCFCAVRGRHGERRPSQRSRITRFSTPRSAARSMLCRLAVPGFVEIREHSGTLLAHSNSVNAERSTSCYEPSTN